MRAADVSRFLSRAVAESMLPKGVAYEARGRFLHGQIGQTWADLSQWLDGQGYGQAARAALLERIEVHEAGRGRVLPLPQDERTTIRGWFAHLAFSADLRATVPEYRALAEQLVIEVQP